MISVEAATKLLDGMWKRGGGNDNPHLSITPDLNGEKVTAPYGLSITPVGPHFVVSTNGHALLAIETNACYDRHPQKESMISGPRGWFLTKARPDRCQLADLLRFAGTVDSRECWACLQGTIYMSSPSVIKGRVIDRAILDRLLFPVASLVPTVIEISAHEHVPPDAGGMPYEMLCMARAEEFFASIMPMRWKAESTKELPQFLPEFGG